MDRYEKALAKARAGKPLEEIFPEMKENEDERDDRIRKAIVQLLTVASESYLIDATGFKKEQFLSYLEKQKEQKPAEWSDKDGMYLSQAIETLEHENYFILAEGLKSLRPQPQPNISISFMLYLDEIRPEGKMCLSNAECNDIEDAFKKQDWPRIFRYIEKYQPHWKPSKEQMGMLLAVINDPNNAGAESCHLMLQSLFADLQKLLSHEIH